jgi:predicted small integral membrane protein
MFDTPMFDTALLFAQLIATGALAAWLTTGVRDNILYPSQNESYTAEVMEMRRIKEEYPEAFEPVAHRAITNRAVQVRLFRCVVALELVATVLLWLGVATLGLALLGLTSPDTARALAMIGATSFTAVWAGMLIVGNHFCYWFGHEGAQNTHYQMTLWGIGTMILIAQ